MVSGLTNSEVANSVRKDYMDRVFNDLRELEATTHRARIAFERGLLSDVFDALVTADTIAKGLFGDFPIIHFYDGKER